MAEQAPSLDVEMEEGDSAKKPEEQDPKQKAKDMDLLTFEGMTSWRAQRPTGVAITHGPGMGYGRKEWSPEALDSDPECSLHFPFQTFVSS